MITVTIKLIGGLKSKSNIFSVNLNKENSLGDLLKNLNIEIFDENGRLRSDMVVLINGRNALFLNGLDTKLKHGDVVLIMPIVVGG